MLKVQPYWKHYRKLPTSVLVIVNVFDLKSNMNIFYIKTSMKIAKKYGFMKHHSFHGDP